MHRKALTRKLFDTETFAQRNLYKTRQKFFRPKNRATLHIHVFSPKGFAQRKLITKSLDGAVLHTGAFTPRTFSSEAFLTAAFSHIDTFAQDFTPKGFCTSNCHRCLDLERCSGCNFPRSTLSYKQARLPITCSPEALGSILPLEVLQFFRIRPESADW